MTIEIASTGTELSERFKPQLDAIAARGLARTVKRISEDAKESIIISPRPSKPGNPPHSRRGKLREAIGFAVNRARRYALVGPRYSKINRIGQTHEFGKRFRGRQYKPRPFMRPALMRNLEYFAASFGGTRA